MRKLFQSRRGVAGFATVVALIPLIASLTVGIEVGGWYVTTRHAQNAADAAAYAGALRVACSLGAVTCTDSDSYDYRGKEFAAKNAFCNAGDMSYPGSTCAAPPTGTTQSVSIDIGTYNKAASPPTWTHDTGGNYVLAVVKQTQPTIFARILGITTITPGAQAVAEVQNPKGVCGLGLGKDTTSNALWFNGTMNITGGPCDFMSDNTAKVGNNLTFNGSGFGIGATSGCTSPCGSPSGVTTNYFMSSATNPLSVLDTETFNSTTGHTKPCGGNVTNGQTCNLSPLSSGAYSDLTVNAGGTLNLASGTYFFYNASLKFSGTVTGSNVNIVLLGNSSLSINAGATVNLSANFNNLTYPSLNGVLFDDQAPNKSSNSITINGNAGNTCSPGTSGCVNLGGALYFPNNSVTWSGTSASAATTCTEVVADQLEVTGSAYLKVSGCAPGTVSQVQVVALVL